MIVSGVHNADVVLRGRRREVRKQYRIDVPIEFQRASRNDFVPAIEIDFASRGPVVLSSFAGRLWSPHVPAERQESPGVVDLPGRHAERHAMTETEFAALAGGAARYVYHGPSHDDPLERVRGILHSVRIGGWTPARDLPTLGDEAAKSVLWSDRAATERRLRQAAERILIVDGKVWTELDEPALSLGADPGQGRREVRIWLRTILGDNTTKALRHFRLDRMDDILDWGRRQGSSVVQVGKLKDDTVVLLDRYRIVEPWTPKRDDARIMLAARLYRPMTESGALVSLLPSAAVDAFVALKKFWLDGDECEVSTPELYGHLKTLAQAIEALSGLSDEAFDRRRKAREGISPVLARWHSHEEARYAQTDAFSP
jgi:hypothetical protein